MIEFKVFGKPACGKCMTTKNKIAHLIGKHNVGGQVSLAYFDLDEADGLVEALMEGVTASYLGLPIVVAKIEGKRMAIWDGRIPLETEIVAFFPKGD
jgi:thioredoxin-like negative regulator of GroEL